MKWIKGLLYDTSHNSIWPTFWDLEMISMMYITYTCVYTCMDFTLIIIILGRWHYHIVGNLHWCKSSYVWPKCPQNKFSYVLISHDRAARPHPCSSPMTFSTACPGLWAFCFDRTIYDIISLWVGCSKIWCNTSYPCSIITTCGEVKVPTKILIVQIFIVFAFICQHAYEIYEN